MKDARMKISRGGDYVWVKSMRHLDLDVIIGIVDSVTHPKNPFQVGDAICFAPREVLDLREVERPHLTLVTNDAIPPPDVLPAARRL